MPRRRLPEPEPEEDDEEELVPPELDEEELLPEDESLADLDVPMEFPPEDPELTSFLAGTELSGEMIPSTPLNPTHYRTNRKGSAREKDNLPAEAGEKVVDFHALFETFKVRWNATAPYPVLGRAPRRAALVGWSPSNLRSVEVTSQIYDTIALICPGRPETDEEGNVTAKGCPCEARYGADPDVWEGSPCPMELMTVFRHFIHYVRDLDVQPEDHVDIQQIVEIVKLHVYESRHDAELQMANRMYDLQVGTLDQKNGKVYWNKVIALALESQERLSNRRNRLYEKLMATRTRKTESRLAEKKANAQIGQAAAQLTTAEMMSELNRESIAARRKATLMPTLVSDEPALDADFSVDAADTTGDEDDD